MATVKWKTDPDEHDYPAAAAYLSLLMKADAVTAVLAILEDAPIVTQKAKDILRAAQLPLLPVSDAHVADDLQKVKNGQPLSPILLLRGQFGSAVPLQVADGYHRVCASYQLNENTDIPCRIADLD